MEEIIEPLRLPLESLPLFISVIDEGGNDDEETEGDNKSMFDNADEDPEPEPAPPPWLPDKAAAIGVAGAIALPSAEIRSSEFALGLG